MDARRAWRAALQWPSWLYQRYREFWDRAILSAGWAILYALCDWSLGAFPEQWRIVLAGAIWVAGMCKPVAAYAAFVLAIAYPLYTISIYVMALALAVLILSGIALARAERWALALVLWVLLAPLLGPVNSVSVLPLLAGLWWGGIGGLIGGGAAAAWLKICASMAGHSPDLWRINGWTMDINLLYARFHSANSFQTVVRLWNPLRGEPASMAGTWLLFNLLQVVSWAAAGYVVGVLHELWMQPVWSLSRPPGSTSRSGWPGPGSGWSAAFSLGPGLLLIWAAYVAVPSWLRVDGPRWFDPLWLPAQVLWAGVIAWCLDAVVRYLQRPVRTSRVGARAGDGLYGGKSRGRRPVGDPATVRQSLWPGRRRKVGRDPGDPLTLLQEAASGPDAREKAGSGTGGDHDPPVSGESDIMIELD
jgi:hypothetical protein